jgi:hypothetical protein
MKKKVSKIYPSFLGGRPKFRRLGGDLPVFAKFLEQLY